MNSEELTTSRNLDVIATEIKAYTFSMLSNIIEIGRRLTEAKEMLPYGQFNQWCSDHFGYSRTQTYNFMRLYDAYGSDQKSLFGAEVVANTFEHLNYSKALALLALPSAEERETFLQENDVSEMTTRELQKAIREKQEAEKRLEDLQKDIEGERAALDKARKQITELENRPVEVAVETVRDEEAIAAAAKEAKEKAEAAAREKILDLEKRLNKAEAAAAKREAGEGVSEKLAEAERIRSELEEARKQLMTSEADVAVFGVHYKSVQKEYADMITALGQIIRRDPEKGKKLVNASEALLDHLAKALEEVQG